ncbi:MAG: hypothetical protein A2X59_02165 [Nitrospirae bacterium GWC2_42_7]|nr:MAG: hypothetical protein A2X59_02165 [Nitrospirae bacterium GWC2_42_7]
MMENIKPSLNFTVICDDARQEVGGKISLMGLFENIYSTSFPASHPRLAIMNEWSDGKGEFEIKLQLLSPDKKTVIREISSKLTLKNVNVRHRDISIHLNIDFQAPGTYWVENFLDGERMNSFPLNVVHVKKQAIH